ncbi:hypothetical protein [Stutzerimonas chloritidismutans]
MDKMREQFEEWYLAQYYEGDEQCGLEWLSTEPCGGYRYAEPAKQWRVWQASRAALVVELPNCFETYGYSAEVARVATDCCADAIEEAGIRAK